MLIFIWTLKFKYGQWPYSYTKKLFVESSYKLNSLIIFLKSKYYILIYDSIN
jgi:hypothetical protein